MTHRGSFAKTVGTLLEEVTLVDRFISKFESLDPTASKDVLSKFSTFRTQIEAYAGINIADNRTALEKSARDRLGDPYLLYLDEVVGGGDVKLLHLKMLNVILTDVNLLVTEMEHLLLDAKDAEGDFREAADSFYDFYACFRDDLLSRMSSTSN